MDSLLTMFTLSILFWVLLLVFSIFFPHKLFNSVLLSIALILSALTILDLFTKDLVMAFLIVTVIIFIVLLLVPFLLIFNGIIMLKREGRSLANLLSLLLGIGIEIGELAFICLIFFNYNMGIAFFQKADLCVLFIGFSVFYFSFLILLFVLYMIYFQYVPHRYDFEYIIIHGCGLLNGDQVSKLLSNRIDKAIDVFHKGKDKAYLIASGGKGGNETISEAEAIARYLKEKGIPEEKILLESRSVSTEENLAFSKQIIEARGGSRRIALVSSNYHIFRCVRLARNMKIPCVGIGAKVAFYYWPSAVIRECVAVYSEKERLFWTIIGYLIFVSPFIYVLLGR